MAKNMTFRTDARYDGSKFLGELAQAAKAFPVLPAQGYAKKRSAPSVNRSLQALFSDHHLGSDLLATEVPCAYGVIEESRRLARVVQNVIEFKIDKRPKTALNLLANGDLFEGMLGHDDRTAAPLAEQFMRAFWLYRQAIWLFAAHFSVVNIDWQNGNHERNKLRHFDRATSAKWDSFGTMLAVALQQSCNYTNVNWRLTKRQYSVVPLPGDKRLLMTHGDTLLNKNPRVSTFPGELAKLNKKPYGPFDICALGHWHDPRSNLLDGGVHLFVNGALVPPNAFAESNVLLSECAQWMWESTDKYCVGDQRLVRVGPEDDVDSSLDSIIAPFDYSHFSFV